MQLRTQACSPILVLVRKYLLIYLFIINCVTLFQDRVDNFIAKGQWKIQVVMFCVSSLLFSIKYNDTSGIILYNNLTILPYPPTQFLVPVCYPV